MMTKNNIYFLLLFFSVDFFFPNELLLETVPEENKVIKIYYNSTGSIIPDYVFPVYAKIEFYDINGESLQNIENTMVDAYWKGENWWMSEILIPVESTFANLNFSSTPFDLSDEFENFTFDIISNYRITSSEINLPFITAEKNIEKAKELILRKDYNDAFLLLDNIINSDYNNNLTAESLYIISEVYLNDFNEYEIAALYLNDIINNYSETNVNKKAVFSLAYLYANYVHFYTDAITLYEKFKEMYPLDDLIPSIDYELNILKNIK